MSARVREIVRKRRSLVARADEQRGEIDVETAAMQQSLGLVDLVWRGFRQLKSRPVGVALAAAALATIGPGKLLRAGYRSGLLVMGLLRVIKIFRSLR